MDLHNVIKKARSLPSATNAKFYRLKSLSQAEKDRKMNERLMKTPSNVELLEDNIDDSIDNNNLSKICPSFDRYRVQAAIKEVTGGLEQSNKHWEKYWAEHLENIDKMKSNMKKTCESSLYEDIESNIGDQSETKNSEHQLVKKKSKIFRNAAIMGLVNTKKISLEDLAESNNENCTKENRLTTLDTQTDNEYQVEFVPLREDPEVFVHPLRMGIDVKKCKDLDFTIPRVGKKIKETPQEYFLRTANDDSFEFVRKNKNTKIFKADGL